LSIEVSGINEQRLGLKYEHETFGRRNAVERFLGLKREQRDSGTDFLSGVLLLQFRVGWRVL